MIRPVQTDGVEKEQCCGRSVFGNGVGRGIKGIFTPSVSCCKTVAGKSVGIIWALHVSKQVF